MASKIYNGVEDSEKIEYDLWENLNKRKTHSYEDIENRFQEESCDESDLESVACDIAEVPKPKELPNINLNFYKESAREDKGDYSPIEIGMSDWENFNPYKKESFYTKPVNFEQKRYVEDGNVLECMGEPCANLIELVVDLCIDTIGLIVKKIFS